MKMQSGMCYSYDQSIGTYMQTKEMQLTNAKFTTVVDLTGVTYSSIAQFTVHRNSYRSIEGKYPYQFSLSLIYDKVTSDEYVNRNARVARDSDVMMTLDINSDQGAFQVQGSALGIQKDKLTLTIDLTRTWEAKVLVDD